MESNELKFSQQLEDSWVHISAKFHAYWTSILGDMNFSSRETESELTVQNWIALKQLD
jgi:hypothetical protein